MPTKMATCGQFALLGTLILSFRLPPSGSGEIMFFTVRQSVRPSICPSISLPLWTFLLNNLSHGYFQISNMDYFYQMLA